MDSSRKSEVTRGVVLPLVVLVVIFALGIVTGEHAVFIAMMAAVPMLAAVFASVPFVALVAVVTFAAGLVLDLRAGRRGHRGQPRPDGRADRPRGDRGDREPVPRTRRRRRTSAPPERRKSVQFQLQTQADLDSMTGLLNRRGAIRALGSRNTEGERVVAFLDCDLFKSVNEQYGSDVGDEFLQAVAGRLRHRLPAHDTVARWDGDEFLLAISADGCLGPPRARAARRRHQRHQHPHDGRPHPGHRLRRRGPVGTRAGARERHLALGPGAVRRQDRRSRQDRRRRRGRCTRRRARRTGTSPRWASCTTARATPPRPSGSRAAIAKES